MCLKVTPTHGIFGGCHGSWWSEQCKGDSNKFTSIHQSMYLYIDIFSCIYIYTEYRHQQYPIDSHLSFLLCFVHQAVWATLHCNLQRSTNLMSLGQHFLQLPSDKKSWTKSTMTSEKSCWIFLKHVSKFVSFLVRLVFSSWFFEEQTWILALPRGLGLAAE